MMNRNTLLGAVCLLAAAVVGVYSISAAEQAGADAKPKSASPPNSVKQLQDDFMKLKFGMFIHYQRCDEYDDTTQDRS